MVNVRIIYILPVCLLLIVFFTLQLNLDPVSASTTYQTKNISYHVNQNSVVKNVKTYATTQNSSKKISNTNKSTTTSISTFKISLSKINAAASTVKTQIFINHKLPSYVTISTHKVSMPQFLDLLTTGLIKIRWGLNTSAILRTVNYPKPGLETVQSSTLNKLEYINMAKSIKTFINVNHRIPSYIKSSKGRLVYGNLIFIYSKIFNFQFTEMRLPNSVSIKSWTYILRGKPIYITSDRITNDATDNSRINSIVKGLVSLGIYAKNWGLGPNTHVQVLQSSHVPKDALIVNIYGGACAGTLYEMGSSWYMGIKGDRKVFSIFWPPATDITGLGFLARAHDDNFTPLFNSSKSGAFPNYYDLNKNGIFDYGKGYVNGVINPTKFTEIDGLAHPDLYLHEHGYTYLNSGNINTIVSVISKLAYA